MPPIWKLDVKTQPSFVSSVQAVSRRNCMTSIAAGVGIAIAAPILSVQALLKAEPPRAADKRSATALVSDDVCKRHETGPGHPESPARYDAVFAALGKAPFYAALQPIKPRPATEAELKYCHADGYVALARREIESGASVLSTGDTSICPDSWKAALLSAGAACTAIDAVVSGKAKNAFCLTRPPGHHATADRGMGFCIFNNVAIAARYAQRKHGVGNVLIVDWDVHHGNGTQDIFYEDGSVFFASTHQSPWYPWTGSKEETGRGKGLGTTLNMPMTRGAGRKEFIAAFENELLPAVSRFQPELVIISAGFDARQGDPLGRLELTDADFADLTDLLLSAAREHAGGRLVSVLEGGYNLTGLASAATAHCQRLQQG